MNIDGLSVAELKSLHAQGSIWLKDIPEYCVYRSILQRCYNPDHKSYPNYGGRGICVYEPWRHDWWLWFEHVGRRLVIPGFRMTIDRLNNDGHYWPGNLEWRTYSEQMSNRRPELTKGEGHFQAKLTLEQVKFVRENYEEFTDAQLGEMLGVTRQTIGDIIRNRRWYDRNWVPPIRVGGGHRNGSRVITPEQAGQAKYLLNQGYPLAVVATIFNISYVMVKFIKSGRSWSWVEPIPFTIVWPKTNLKRRV